MMVAGQPVLGGIGQHVADHAAQRVLDQNVVADVIDGHGALEISRCDARLNIGRVADSSESRPSGKSIELKEKVEASVARCLRTPPNGA